jgi:hypothetical protein
MSKFKGNPVRPRSLRYTGRYEGWNKLLPPHDALTPADVKDYFFLSKSARLRAFDR